MIAIRPTFGAGSVKQGLPKAPLGKELPAGAVGTRILNEAKNPETLTRRDVNRAGLLALATLLLPGFKKTAEAGPGDFVKHEGVPADHVAFLAATVDFHLGDQNGLLNRQEIKSAVKLMTIWAEKYPDYPFIKQMPAVFWNLGILAGSKDPTVRGRAFVDPEAKAWDPGLQPPPSPPEGDLAPYAARYGREDWLEYEDAAKA